MSIYFRASSKKGGGEELWEKKKKKKKRKRRLECLSLFPLPRGVRRETIKKGEGKEETTA